MEERGVGKGTWDFLSDSKKGRGLATIKINIRCFYKYVKLNFVWEERGMRGRNTLSYYFICCQRVLTIFVAS